ncbi:hypothetical protein EHS25_002880 [Saitozyma podzolica]|uniref:Major facilitator superfamily (MFS) profile domain-containing protein n=1 Tax=Saitozyma podzolica TaxID=1890683 RepID=A0A427YC75_9TREE|nr:hypothetical protein EHS25_002880 [Saitozyma podzolica]
MSNSDLSNKERDVQLDVPEKQLAEATQAQPEAVNVIQNPLQHRSIDELDADVTAFCQEHGPEAERQLFYKGALVARSPDQWLNLTELTEEEKQVFTHEKEHKWSGTFTLYFSMFICALGAATQGWDQTGSNGANLSFPQEFGIASTVGQPSVAAVSDPLNKWFGHRGEIFLIAIVLMVTPIASGFSRNWQQLLIIRLILGLGLGAKAATVPAYAAEMAPAAIRGALTMGWQLWVCFGIFLGFAANVVVKDVGKIAWRLQLGSAFVPALPLALGIFFAPESPRWLMKKGRYADAFKSFCRLRKHRLIAARDLYYSHVLFEEELRLARGASYFTRLADCFRVPRIRRATLGASVVMLAQQMCGINIISFYSSTVFTEGGYSVDQALYASLGFGAVNFVFAIPAVFTVDTFGRRSLLLSTFPFMCHFLLATGLSFLMSAEHEQTRTALIAASFIYIFTAFYSVGEVCFYAGLNALALLWIFLFVPETKAMTLEELDQVFSVPTTSFIKYESTVWLPYMFKRYITRQSVQPIRPLFEKEGQADHL